MILFEDIMILQWLSQVKLNINDGGTFSQNKRKRKAIPYVHEQAGKSKSSKHWYDFTDATCHCSNTGISALVNSSIYCSQTAIWVALLDKGKFIWYWALLAGIYYTTQEQDSNQIWLSHPIKYDRQHWTYFEWGRKISINESMHCLWTPILSSNPMLWIIALQFWVFI